MQPDHDADNHSGGLGNAGAGASSDFPLLFSGDYHHDWANPLSPPLAIARTGGRGGQVFVYAEDHDARGEQAYTSFAGGGRRWF